jgi:hypothetical protein
MPPSYNAGAAFLVPLVGPRCGMVGVRAGSKP